METLNHVFGHVCWFGLDYTFTSHVPEESNGPYFVSMIEYSRLELNIYFL
jgi:hypothetical protein